MVKDVWEPVASMKHCRSAHGVTVYQGRIFALGKENSTRVGTQVAHRPRSVTVYSLLFDSIQFFDYHN